MAFFKPGFPVLKRLRDLFIGAANPADDSAPDWYAKIRKAIVSGIMGFLGSGTAWVTAKTNGAIDIPLPVLEGLVTSIVGGLLNWAATYFPWNRKAA